MSAKIPKPSSIAATIERLSALQVRQEQLNRVVADVSLREGDARDEIGRAQRALNSATVSGLYDAPPEITSRLQDAQAQLADLLDRRAEAEEELKSLPALRVGVIRENVAAVWGEYVGAKARYIEAADAVAGKCEKIVAEYDTAAQNYEDVRDGLRRILKPVGVHAERVLGDLRREHPEPMEPTADPDGRQGLRRAARLRQLYREDLRWPS